MVVPAVLPEEKGLDFNLEEVIKKERLSFYDNLSSDGNFMF